MCSIVGIGFQKNHTFFNRQVVNKLITKLLINGMSHGKTATGLCYISNEEIAIVKDRINAEKFTKTEFYKDVSGKHVCFEDASSKYLLSVIGHCRQKTKGTELNNDNNHPIRCGNVVGVHNGMISNDDIQFDKYKNVWSRKAQVDSEIIFALINHFTKDSVTKGIQLVKACTITKGIQRACSCLNGSYACAMVHCFQPHILWLFRGNNPCTIYHFKKKGIIIFASFPSIIVDSILDYSFGTYDEIPLDSYEGMGIDLHNNRYQKFDLKTPSAKEKAIQL